VRNIYLSYGHIFGLDKSCYTWKPSSEAQLAITELHSKNAFQTHLKSTPEDLISALLLKNIVVAVLRYFSSKWYCLTIPIVISSVFS